MGFERFFVFTGGPGAGKTTLVNALRAQGFAATQEAGRAVIQSQTRDGGGALPWDDRLRFAARMLAWETDSYRQAELTQGPVFFDRGAPDTIGYLRLVGLEVPASMAEDAARLHYNCIVFIAPPWKAIYGIDEERRQSWQVAVRTHETMARTYTDLGYELIELPCEPVEERARIVLDRIASILPALPRLLPHGRVSPA